MTPLHSILSGTALGIQERLEALESFLDEHRTEIMADDEGMVRCLIERITVFDDRLTFEFKSGLRTDVQD